MATDLRRRKTPPATRFWAKVNEQDECWVWTGAILRNGYGYFGVTKGRCIVAHRFAYMSMIGEIPEGLDLDHLCRNRACVNPYHLQPVTRRVNLRRGIGPQVSRERLGGRTHCIRGHEFTELNTYRAPNGTRKCRECYRVADRERKRAKRSGALNGH